MRILVLGGSGFVGRHLFEAFRDGGSNHHEVILSSRRRPDWLEVESNGNNPIRWIATDLSKGLFHELDHCQADVVVNLVADQAWDQDSALRNLKIAQSALEVAMKVQATRFIQVSSLAIFGEIDPKTKPSPDTNYGLGKWQSELYLKERCASKKIDLIILRPGLIYGRHDQGALYQYLSLVRNRRLAPLFGLTPVEKNWTSVNLLVAAILSQIQNSRDMNGSIELNVFDSAPRSLHQVTDFIRDTGFAFLKVYIPRWLVRMFSWVAPQTAVRISLRKALSPKIPLPPYLLSSTADPNDLKDLVNHFFQRVESPSDRRDIR